MREYTQQNKKTLTKTAHIAWRKILPYTISNCVLPGFWICWNFDHVNHSAWFHTLLSTQRIMILIKTCLMDHNKENVINLWSSSYHSFLQFAQASCSQKSSVGLFTLPSRFSRGLARLAISSSYLNLPQNPPFVTVPAFLVHWRRRGYACKNEFTSECRLQTRLTIYKYKNASIFFILLTTCFLSRQKPCKDSSSASFS